MKDKDFRKYFIHRSVSVKEALKQMDEGAEKILFVTEGNNILYGTLTDGDIRRWVLSNGELSAPVEKASNHEPFRVSTGYDEQYVRDVMVSRNIMGIPVVNGANEIVDVLWWERMFKQNRLRDKQKIDIPVVIMAGGKGTRLDPFTKILPKPLIPIGDKAIINHIIDRFLEYQIKDFYISVNHKSKIIKAYFEEIDTPYNVSYILEDKPLGTAGALKYLEGKIEGDFFISNCDIIIESDYADVLQHHRRSGCDLTMVASLKHYNIPYGVCDLDENGNLLQIREKPEFDFLVNTGMYVVNAKVLSMIPEGEFFHITDLMEKIQRQGGNVGVFPVSDKAWVDIGEWSEYKKALSRFNME